MPGHDLSTAKPETLALHAGWRADPANGSVAVPIHQTTSYQFRDTEHAESLFALRELGNIYTRVTNPTVDVLEQRLAALEGGAGALALASGQAASALSVQNLARAGDNIVSSTDLYGGTWNLFANTLSEQGIEVRFVDPADPQAFARATDERTRAYYAETLPNPKLTVFPIREVAEIGRPLGIPLIVDNTAAPLIGRPLAHGAAIVVYSTTKYIAGHGVAIGGAIIDGGTFDWTAHPARQPALTNPDPSYHGAVWTEVAQSIGPIAYALRARVRLLRDLGPAVAPLNAFLTLQGLETLPLRIERHSRNALAVARWLQDRPEVVRVIHPSLQVGQARERADRVLAGGYGGLVGFELAAGRAAGRRFIDALRLFYHVANIGDARSFLFESVEQGYLGTNVVSLLPPFLFDLFGFVYDSWMGTCCQGRYSFVGAQPAMEIVAKENLVSIMDHEEGRRTEEVVDDPMEIPRRIMEGWSPQVIDELPDAFCGMCLYPHSL